MCLIIWKILNSRLPAYTFEGTLSGGRASLSSWLANTGGGFFGDYEVPRHTQSSTLYSLKGRRLRADQIQVQVETQVSKEHDMEAGPSAIEEASSEVHELIIMTRQMLTMYCREVRAQGSVR
jgi:hypothetical protein